MLDKIRVRPDHDLDLDDFDPRETFGWEKEAAKAELVTVMERAAVLQARLFAEERRALLVVLQAFDAAGKDGTIRSVFTGLNPAGVKVTGFRVPSGREVKQDYLWRVHAACPGTGEIGVFNRSHYEDVLVVRVKQFVPESRWKRRYDHIRHFEQLLTDEGTKVVKIFLNVSAEEQRARFQDRIDDPEEQWKFRLGDLDDRALWDDYRAAYRDALERTSTDDCPWYVVPADRKWVRNLAVARILVDALEAIDPQLPEPEAGLEGLVVAPLD
ncbi:MAG: polyphosphate kinase 2 family protein [Ilumatobacteraceae bacterium]